MKASTLLRFSHEQHQELACAISELGNELDVFQAPTEAMLGETRKLPIDISKVPVELDGLGTFHTKANFSFAVSNELGQSASIDLYGPRPGENTYLTLAGDEQNWNVMRGDRDHYVDVISHQNVVRYMSDAIGGKRVNNLPKLPLQDDISAIQSLSHIFPLSREERLYSAETHHISQHAISPIDTSLSIVKKNGVKKYNLSIASTADATLAGGDMSVTPVRLAYSYSLDRQKGRMDKGESRVTLQDASEQLDYDMLRNMARHEQTHIGRTDPAERLHLAIAQLRAGCLDDILLAS